MNDPYSDLDFDDPSAVDWHIRLRELLTEALDEHQLAILSFDLRTDYDRLPGDKARKVVELVKKAAREQRVGALIDHASRMHPSPLWPELRAAASRYPLHGEGEAPAYAAFPEPTTPITPPLVVSSPPHFEPPQFELPAMNVAPIELPPPSYVAPAPHDALLPVGGNSAPPGRDDSAGEFPWLGFLGLLILLAGGYYLWQVYGPPGVGRDQTGAPPTPTLLIAVQPEATAPPLEEPTAAPTPEAVIGEAASATAGSSAGSGTSSATGTAGGAAASGSTGGTSADAGTAAAGLGAGTGLTATGATSGTEQALPPGVLDNFEALDAGSLRSRFWINNNAGNSGALRLSGAPHVGEGKQAVAFDYNILYPSPRQYVGFNRDFPPQDWTGYSALCFWVEGDGAKRTLVLQFGESDSTLFKTASSLAKGTGDYCIPLKPQQVVNLLGVAYYGVYVEGPPTGLGTLYVDNIRLVK